MARVHLINFPIERKSSLPVQYHHPNCHLIPHLERNLLLKQRYCHIKARLTIHLKFFILGKDGSRLIFIVNWIELPKLISLYILIALGTLVSQAEIVVIHT